MHDPLPETSSLSDRTWHRRSSEYAETWSDLLAGAVVAAGFLWRLWLAHATYFNTDEAWHWSVANQNSLSGLYQAAWSRGLGETLRAQSNEFAGIEPHVFDYYIEIFKLPPSAFASN